MRNIQAAPIWTDDSWEHEFESIADVHRINDENYSDLKKFLSGSESEDSFLTSPNYYFFTGRNGLWIYEHKDGFLVVCWHPNIPGKIVIFSPLNKSGFDLVSDLLDVIPLPRNGISIARIGPDFLAQNLRHQISKHEMRYHIHKEEVLDWVFPVHVLSTHKVANTQGSQFMAIRNRLRQTHKHSIKVLPFDAIHHSRSIENLLHDWAKHNAENAIEYDQLYAPYEKLFSISIDNAAELSGLMIYADGNLRALALWDISNSQRKTANLFINFCDIEIKGLSELLIVKACETLYSQGVEYLNLGGSETKGLDLYKRKFQPVQSIDLRSIEVNIQETRIGKLDSRISKSVA